MGGDSAGDLVGLWAVSWAVMKVLKVVEWMVSRSAEKMVSMTAADLVVIMVVCWADHLDGMWAASLVDKKASHWAGPKVAYWVDH